MTIEFHLRVHPGEDLRRFETTPVFWADTPPPRAWDVPVRPTDSAFLIRQGAEGLEAVVRRWWLVPAFHKGPLLAWKTLCANAEIESLETSPIFREAYASRRALVPLTSFVVYEEPPGWRKGQPKRRWEATWTPTGPADKVRYFAAVWDRAETADGTLESFAIVTGPAGADLAGLQDSEPAVLTLAQGLDWLKLDGPGKAGLVTQTPAGTYNLEEAPRDAVMSRELRRSL
ncbi:SOS response-associated peptidase family protein [Phenylobacterium ferrooxidans]|uniref:SOS response-associated peptidase n=1 Tax=Phenylobacterium ferrooxidans TaxID=2982689 RepID=A0ABW6CJT7_9CAUL